MTEKMDRAISTYMTGPAVKMACRTESLRGMSGSADAGEADWASSGEALATVASSTDKIFMRKVFYDRRAKVGCK